jgi:single-stranded DNA-binding protein
MNKVLLTGRLTRDPEMRSLASGKVVTTFTVASNEFIGGGKEKAEYHFKGKVYRRIASRSRRSASFTAMRCSTLRSNAS